MYSIPHHINGQKVTQPGPNLEVFNPALGEVIGQLHVATPSVIDQAIKTAFAAQLAWQATPASVRASILFRFKALLEEHKNDLAKIVTQEHGKTLAESLGSLQRGLDVVDFACGIPYLLKGSFAENVAKEVDCYSLHQPLGICVGITPFNFPAMIPLWMFPLAIACGNTFILKPSEKDPSCSLKLVELAEAAGVPAGVVNVVQGDKSTVDALITHPKVQAVSFVGSSAVAKYVHQTATEHHKRVQAFGGAKNHCILMPDANLDQAVKAIVPSAYGCAGERCMAISVVVAVGDAVADAFIEQAKPLLSAIRVGAGVDANIDMGPLITHAHWEKVKHYLQLGVQEGASLVLDGGNDKPVSHPRGFFMGPSLFDHVTANMRIYQEEIFGPVLCVMRVKDFDQALQLVNDHAYGNGAAIFTSDGYVARRFAESAQAGMIGVNIPIPVPVAYQSFGGWKQSVFADIGMYGQEAVRFYTKLKTVTQRWFAGSIRSPD